MAEALLSEKSLRNCDFESKFLGLSKNEIKIPSTRRRNVSLSDIIAATIGEEARSCDMPLTNEISDISFDFLESICEVKPEDETGSQQSEAENSNFDWEKHTSLPRNDCFLNSENSTNACDSFGLIHSQHDIVDTSNTGNQGNTENGDLGFHLTTSLGFESEVDFLSEGFGLTQAGEAKQSTDTTDGGNVTSPISDNDSDLEDSMHFVDPSDTSLHEILVHNRPDEQNLEPQSKKPRLSDIDINSCPALNGRKYEYDCNPQFLAFLDGDVNESVNVKSNFPGLRTNRSRSFSGNTGPGLSRQKARLPLHERNSRNTPTNLLRTRSFSEACNRSELSPPFEGRFNTSFSSLLESPENTMLTNNPIFSELKSTLLSDCQTLDCPKTLFDTLSTGPKHDVYARERNLGSKFSSLQNKYPDEVKILSAFYRQQSADIETERLKEIHDDNLPKSYRNHLNSYYDNQLHKIMERVEKSLGLLSTAMKDITINRAFKTRTMFSRKAVTMMEEWLLRNYEHPYPSQTAIEALAKAGELTPEQVKKWFANRRNRTKNTKPVTEIANLKRKRQFSARW